MRATHRRAPRATLAALTALAAVVAFAVPATPALAAEAPADADQWVVPLGTPLPDDAVVESELTVVDAVVVRSASAPTAGVALDAPLRWQAEADNGVGPEQDADERGRADERPEPGFRAPGPPDSTADAAPGLQSDTEESEPSDTVTNGPIAEGTVSDAVTATQAPTVWEGGEHGANALVALIDTGVANVGGLEDSVAGEVDFTGTGGGDGYGHGTYMASLIAASTALVPGAAPEAGIVSLKVGDDDGATDLGTVLAALEWLHGPGRDLGIRVGTLALGAEAESPAGLLLDVATQRLAAHGILIVTAAGNEGPGNLTSPATSPGTLSVGALDGDDRADFSATGDDRAGNSAPDAYAPGVDVLGHHAPESEITALAREGADDEALERLEQGLLLGTGTSAATGLTAGVAALVSSTNPTLDGPEIAEALMHDGATLNAVEAVSHAAGMEGERPTEPTQPGPPAVPGPPSQPGPPGEQGPPGQAGSASQAGPPAHAGDLPTGEDADPTPMYLPLVAEWEPAEWNGSRWVASDWAGDRWSGNPLGHPGAISPQVFSWRAADWQGGVWDAASWHASAWTADDWAALRYEDAWDVFSWRGEEWDVFSWRSDEWDVFSWRTDAWDVFSWRGDEWDVFSWRDLQTEVFSWRGDDWDVFSWRGEDWTLIVDD